MRIIHKGDVTITMMTREETGVLSPCESAILAPILKKGYSVKEAQEIRTLMSCHNMSMEEAEKKRKENLEWV